MMMSILQVEKLCKTYQKQTVLNQISFSLNSGEYFGLIGVNGAGKTTLLKSILDFCHIDAGYIAINHQTHTHPTARQSVAFLPEQFMPPWFLTGQSFLQHISQLRDTLYQKDHISTLCQYLDFPDEFLTKPIRHYSKGMAQKLALMSCFLQNCQLLILDEPMSGLDPKARAYLKRFLLKQKAEKKTTLFFSAHLLADVEILCDRMGILHQGELRFIGTPAECCQQFATNNLEQAYLRCIEADI
ncbi:ABC transporter ATP-binding protein [Thioflexithrix psekupsensis]|uniref:ABC transporter ATP-binding protein n=1 Tax=Thioflexithrix psekupsensis TaxID=1570016 RepID=A0A251X7C0_9GAMM|nr:ABC transporter ATP-binding protein [Thioflexithrix psekupsensis]OUD13361.1 ABC transporter ATP-binding protein [Thioflexithrix psekupsensis]